MYNVISVDVVCSVATVAVDVYAEASIITTFNSRKR